MQVLSATCAAPGFYAVTVDVPANVSSTGPTGATIWTGTTGSTGATGSAGVTGAAGLLMTLTSGTITSGTVPGGKGFFQAFSCQ